MHVQRDENEELGCGAAVSSRHVSFCARMQAYERDEESIEWSKNIERVMSNVADHVMQVTNFRTEVFLLLNFCLISSESG